MANPVDSSPRSVPWARRAFGWLWLLCGLSPGCASPRLQSATMSYLTPTTPALQPDNGFPASSEYTLLALVTGEACMQRAELARLGDLPPSPAMLAEGGVGHPAVYQAAKYEALSKIDNADNLTSIRAKVERIGEQECVSITGRAYRLRSMQVRTPMATQVSAVGAAPAGIAAGPALTTIPSRELVGAPAAAPSPDKIDPGTSLFFALPDGADLGAALRLSYPLGPRGVFPTHWPVSDRVVLDLHFQGMYDKIPLTSTKLVMLAPSLGLAYNVWLLRFAGLYTRFGFGYGALTADTGFSSVEWKENGLDFEVGFGTFFTLWGMAGIQAEITHRGSFLVGLLFGF